MRNKKPEYDKEFWKKKHLFILLPKLLIKGRQKYCETAYSSDGIYRMCILKEFKGSLEGLKSPNFNHIISLKSFDFLVPYTTIPRQKLKSCEAQRFYVYRDASHLWRSFLHNKTKINIQNL